MWLHFASWFEQSGKIEHRKFFGRRNWRTQIWSLRSLLRKNLLKKSASRLLNKIQWRNSRSGHLYKSDTSNISYCSLYQQLEQTNWFKQLWLARKRIFGEENHYKKWRACFDEGRKRRFVCDCSHLKARGIFVKSWRAWIGPERKIAWRNYRRRICFGRWSCKLHLHVWNFSNLRHRILCQNECKFWWCRFVFATMLFNC